MLRLKNLLTIYNRFHSTDGASRSLDISSICAIVQQYRVTTGIARIAEENVQRYLEFDPEFGTAESTDMQIYSY
jgi:hypothetical protein